MAMDVGARSSCPAKAGYLARNINVHGDGGRGEVVMPREAGYSPGTSTCMAMEVGARSSCPAKRGTRPFLLYTASKLPSFLVIWYNFANVKEDAP